MKTVKVYIIGRSDPIVSILASQNQIEDITSGIGCPDSTITISSIDGDDYIFNADNVTHIKVQGNARDL